MLTAEAPVMAKRGRPKTGKTVSVRIPEEIHLMVAWIADARRTSVTKVLERLLVDPVVHHYILSLDTIKQLKAIEDTRARIDGREPIPLPKLKVKDRSDRFSPKPTPLVSPEDFTLEQLLKMSDAVERKWAFEIEGYTPPTVNLLPEVTKHSEVADPATKKPKK
jgi:phosphoribosylformylglycinamidine (FGAM) synthase PurS component